MCMCRDFCRDFVSPTITIATYDPEESTRQSPACLFSPSSPSHPFTQRAPLRGLAPLLLAQPSTPAHSQRPCLLAPSLSSHTWWYGTPRWVRTREELRQGPQSSGPDGGTVQPCSHLASSSAHIHNPHTHIPPAPSPFHSTTQTPTITPSPLPSSPAPGGMGHLGGGGQGRTRAGSW